MLTLLDIKDVAGINMECFGRDDSYSDYRVLLELDNTPGNGILVHKEKGTIAGYLVYSNTTEGLTTVRMGTTYYYRGKGIAKKLIRKILKQAKEQKVAFKTYISLDNISSINAHIGVGLKIIAVEDKEWVWVGTSY